ncbi:MAG: NAD(P)-dependent oxidoreductase, partial [Planctomycetota bacterium]
MKILVACALPDFALERLRTLGSEVGYEPDLRSEQFREAITGVGILIVDAKRVSPEVIARGDMLQMIVRAGPGPGDIALETASAQGIFVSHCPDQHAIAVAELTIGLMIALDRGIVENTNALHEQRWIRHEFGDAKGLYGRTLGILGFNSIGQRVAERAVALGMQVAVWCPVAASDTPTCGNLRFVNGPRELARQSDIVAVQPLEECGEHQALVDTEFLENMRPGAALVHVGHPTVLEEAALAEAVKQRGLRVALDVFGSQPTGDAGRFRCKLAGLPGVIGTQHLGPLTEQAR